MKYIFLFCILWMNKGAVIAQNKYPVSSIPAALLKNADAVVRNQTLVFDIANKGEALETEHVVITLLNENAAALSEPSFFYSEFSDIVNIEASVYEADGSLVRNLKKKDIEDRKPLMNEVNDFRYKILHLPGHSYPYTIEYSVQTKQKGLMFYPEFQPQFSPEIAVEYASFEVKSPTGLMVRFREVNMPENSKIGAQKWALSNIPAFRQAAYTSESAMPYAMVLAAPTAFSFGGLDGDMTSWQSFGDFMNRLNQNRQILSEVTVNKLQALVADCRDMTCKIEKVYQYLQENTRYYYVGLGIGGFQPALASKVDDYKYGDCKGLSNYTVAMLNAVGVPARYVLIRAGQDQQFAQKAEFPNAWFNHAIVCVPMEKDTIWLECTSQTQTCGFMGNFTDNRLALVMTPEGGVVVHTPVYDETKNSIKRTTNIALNPDGSAKLNTLDVYSGISQSIPAELEGLHDEIRKKYLYKVLDINNFEIISLEFKRNRQRLPSVEQRMSLALPNYSSVNGKRIFLPLSVLSQKREIPLDESFNDAFFQPDSRGFTEADSIVIALPIGYKLEAEPAPVSIESKFGTYQNEVKSVEGSLVVKRKLVLNSIQRPKEDFGEFIKFLKSINKADKSKLVLVKENTGP